MGKSNNILFVLTVLLLFVSIFGTVNVMTNLNPTPSPEPGSAAIQTGKVSLEIIPMGKSYDSTTGYVSLTILPEE